MKKIKVLAFYRGKIFESRGTPIRIFNILSRLETSESIDLSVCSWDKDAGCFSKHLFLDNNHIEDLKKIISYVKKNKIDIIIGYTASSLYYLPFLKFLTSAKIVYEMHGFMEDEALAYGSIGKIKYKLMKIAFGFIYRLCDLITTSEGPSTESILKKYNDSILTLSGGVNLSEFTPFASSGGFINKDGKIIIGYAGNARVWQGLDFLIDGYRKLNKITNKFKLALLLSEKKDFGPEIEVINSIPNNEVPHFLVDCDILVIPRPDIPATHIGFPSKLSEYTAMGKALVVSNVGDMDKFLVHNDSGLIYKAGNTDEFIKCILSLEDEAFRNKLGKEALKVASSLSWESIVSRLIDRLSKMVYI